MKLNRLAVTLLVLSSTLTTSCSSFREHLSNSGKTMRSWVGMEEEAKEGETGEEGEVASVIEEEKAVLIEAADEAKAELRSRLDEALRSFTSEWAEIAGPPSGDEESPIVADRAFVMRAIIGAWLNPDASEGIPAEEAAMVRLALENPDALQGQLLLALYADLVAREAKGHPAEREVLRLMSQIQEKLREPAPEPAGAKR